MLITQGGPSYYSPYIKKFQAADLIQEFKEISNQINLNFTGAEFEELETQYRKVLVKLILLENRKLYKDSFGLIENIVAENNVFEIVESCYSAGHHLIQLGFKDDEDHFYDLSFKIRNCELINHITKYKCIGLRSWKDLQNVDVDGFSEKFPDVGQKLIYHLDILNFQKYENY